MNKKLNKVAKSKYKNSMSVYHKSAIFVDFIEKWTSYSCSEPKISPISFHTRILHLVFRVCPKTDVLKIDSIKYLTFDLRKII